MTVPTRLTQCKGTLIDNFFVKVSHDYSPTTTRVLLNQISDHLPCFISLDFINSQKISEKFIKICPSGLMNYENFKNDLSSTEASEKLRNCIKENVNDSCNFFQDVLAFYVDKHFPQKYVRFNKYKHRRSKWVTSAILKSISFRDKLYIKLKSTSETSSQYQQILTDFKTYNKILKQTIRSAKKIFFQNCFQKYQCDVKKNWDTINDVLNKTKKTKDYPKEFIINGSSESHEDTIVNKFNEYFIKIGPNLSKKIKAPIGKSFKDYLRTPNNTNFWFDEVDANAVIKAIDTLKPKTSFGHDRISNKLLKYVKQEVAWSLAKLVNQSFTEGVFPNSLKIAKVTPLHKKGENCLFDNYRPVSILPSVSKVFERLMHDQIYNYFQINKIFFESEYAFRPNHSTEFSTLELIDRIIFEMDKNNTPLSIFMDLSKAFDTLDHQILLHKMKFYGFANNSFNLIASYLSNRMQYVMMNNMESDLLTLECGVPQGSILGPLLFIIYMNDLPNITKCLVPIIYADDTTLLTSFRNTNYAVKRRQINK